MKQLLIKDGEAYIEDVPAPTVGKGNVLVRTAYSCISPGTEMSGVVSSGEPLWKRAMKDPSKVKKAFQMISSEGFLHTNAVIRGELESGSASGYSAAGVIIGVGADIHDLKVGDRVACAGAQCAYHAERINIPRNLIVAVPDELAMEKACTVTLGSIALQAVRRAQPTLGETFVVIGLGLIGQLVAQLLKVNGCRVIGTDLSEERLNVARKDGISSAVNSKEDFLNVISSITKNTGADGVIVTASAPENSEIISAAFSMCRKKGRVVVVGDVGLSIAREDIYRKELDFFISTSYGPGRYDDRYEKEGLDYPIGYVRWTENRNMEAYLQLLVDGNICVNSLVSKIYDIKDASAAYQTLKPENSSKPLMVLLHYPKTDTPEKTDTKCLLYSESLIERGKDGIVRIGMIGAGGFSKATLLPALKDLKGMYKINAICARTGHVAKNVATQFGAGYATTDVQDIILDGSLDAVLVATRHDSHAELVKECLLSGKHVFVEKPLALNQDELDELVSVYEKISTSLVLQTGFNRRFSPHSLKIKGAMENRVDPVVINYTMNAGYIDKDHWIQGSEGGGRNIGEACHIYDLFTFLIGTKVKDVSVSKIGRETKYSSNDNFVVTLSYEDGSIATLCYTSMGRQSYPKERMEVFCGGDTYILDDYKKTTLYSSKVSEFKTQGQEKGHKMELEQFYKVIREGGGLAIPFWQQIQATSISFQVNKALLN